MSETYTPENLFAGNVSPVVTETATIAAGNLTKGTVLGLITANGKLAIVDSTKSDGTQTPYAILAEATDASGGDKVAPVYLTGEFNQAALVFGGTDTYATHKAAARKIGLFFKSLF